MQYGLPYLESVEEEDFDRVIEKADGEESVISTDSHAQHVV